MFKLTVLLLVLFPLLAIAEQTSEKKNVAIMIFEGVQIIDYTAPYEVLGQAGYHVYTVSEKTAPLKTSMNMTVTPDYDFTNAPQPFILVLPGGGVDPHLSNTALINWVKKTTAGAQYVLTVCNGAFFAGKAGLLDGLTATTFHALITQLQELAPKAHVVRDKRYVDNGKIITSAGLTSGMDSSLYLVSKIQGMQKAKELALHLEYNWDPASKYARAAFADRYLDPININPPADSNWQTLENFGDLNSWEYKASTTKPAPADFMKDITDQVHAAKWSQKSGDANHLNWVFQDENGKPWNGTMTIDPPQGQTYTVTFKVCRAS